MSRLAVVLLLAAMAASPALAQEKPAPKTWKDALAVLRKAETVDDEAVGEGGDKSDFYRAFEVLRDEAPLGELFRLVRDDDPEVRCYAFRAVVARRRAAAEQKAEDDLLDVMELVIHHFDDLKTVQTFRGCTMQDELVGDVMIQDVRQHLDPAYQRGLVDRLVFGHARLEQRGILLRSHTFPADYLERLRKLHDKGDTGALVAIARLRDPEDASRIAKVLRAPPTKVIEMPDEFLAASLHPHPSHWSLLAAFAPAVEKLLPEHKNPHRFGRWLRAVAAHDRDEVADLLTGFLEPELPDYVSGERAELVFGLVKSGDRDWDRYANLFWTLWIDHRRVDEQVLDHLADWDAARVLEQAEKDLRQHLNEMPRGTVGPLLDALWYADEERGNAVLTHALGTVEVGNASAVISRAGTWCEKPYVEPLFGLYVHWNPHVYVAAARALLAYDDPEIDARLEKTSERKGWGGKKLRRVLDAKPRTWNDGRDF